MQALEETASLTTLFEPVVAAESRDLEKGYVETIKIMNLEFPSGTIVQSLTAFNHAVGSVVEYRKL